MRKVFVRNYHQNNQKVALCRSLSTCIENTFSLNGFRHDNYNWELYFIVWSNIQYIFVKFPLSKCLVTSFLICAYATFERADATIVSSSFPLVLFLLAAILRANLHDNSSSPYIGRKPIANHMILSSSIYCDL